MVKRSLPRQHLEGQNSDRPDIHEVVVGVSFKNLGADIVEGAAICCPALLAIRSPAEVTKLAYSLSEYSGYIGENNILRFNIAVEDVLSM